MQVYGRKGSNATANYFLNFLFNANCLHNVYIQQSDKVILSISELTVLIFLIITYVRVFRGVFQTSFLGF